MGNSRPFLYASRPAPTPFTEPLSKGHRYPPHCTTVLFPKFPSLLIPSSFNINIITYHRAHLHRIVIDTYPPFVLAFTADLLYLLTAGPAGHFQHVLLTTPCRFVVVVSEAVVYFIMRTIEGREVALRILNEESGCAVNCCKMTRKSRADPWFWMLP